MTIIVILLILALLLTILVAWSLADQVERLGRIIDEEGEW